MTIRNQDGVILDAQCRLNPNWRAIKLSANDRKDVKDILIQAVKYIDSLHTSFAHLPGDVNDAVSLSEYIGDGGGNDYSATIF